MNWPDAIEIAPTPIAIELDHCRDLGKRLSRHLTGCVERKIISMSELLAQEQHHA